MADILPPVILTGSYIDGLASELLLKRPPSGELLDDLPKDIDWLRQAFIVGSSLPNADGEVIKTTNLTPIDSQNRRFSTADLKYTDSSTGGNICINPPPQFTRYADIRKKGIRRDNETMSLGLAKKPHGMGRYYSEAIDDNNQIIHMRMGVAQHNSMTQFFTGFYSSEAGSAARTGRLGPGFFEGIGAAIGKVIAFTIAPLAIIPVAVLMLGNAVRFLANVPSSKFYTLKPSMPLYWNAVTNMVNQLAVNKGIVNYFDRNTKDRIIGSQYVFGQSEASVINRLMPDIISKNGTIDVYAIANKTKRLETFYEGLRADAFAAAVGQKGDEEFIGLVTKTLETERTTTPEGPNPSLEALLFRFLSTPALSRKKEAESNGIEKDYRYPQAGTEQNQLVLTPENKQINSIVSHFIANLADGSDWASFRVDYTGPVGESFSNSTAKSSLAQKINSLSASNREVRFNYGGAAASIPGLETVLGAAGQVLGNVASVLHLEGLATFAGSAFIDIPDNWESSVSSLPKSTYTMTLISPYGNQLSQMLNMYIPLCMILAAGLPLSTGKQSHTSPFLCELHDRGRSMTRLGIIDNISITRGKSNLGFNNEGQAMAIEVSFGVKDLSSLVTMPILANFSSQPLAGLFDGENAFTDYLMALSGMKLGDTIYRLPLLKYQINRKIGELDTFFSASHFAQYTANLPGVNLLSAFFRGTTRK